VNASQLYLGIDGAMLPRFGGNFLEDHARRIVTDARIALIEIVANCWDAGATRVDVTWPKDSVPDPIVFEDDGVGMTLEEFKDRWLELSYNRLTTQGIDVIFPAGRQAGHRTAYGRNGKGRHALFCFSDRYVVETWRDGTSNVFNVSRNYGTSPAPYSIRHERQYDREGNGTVISTELNRNALAVKTVKDLIGSKFVSDPSLRIYVNGDLVELMDLEHLLDTREYKVPGVGTVIVHCIDSQKKGRTTRQNGVAWWVNKRRVGEASWRGFDDQAYLDGRSSPARRYTFVVEADVLAEEVEADWSGFRDSEKSVQVQRLVRQRIKSWLGELLRHVHKSKKREALEDNVEMLRGLSTVSRKLVGEFVDELQSSMPTLDRRALSATVAVLANLEKSRTGVYLLEQLAELDPTDLAGLSEILDRWTVQDALIVLNELEWRLDLIRLMEKRLECPSSDELHEIQPLFNRGLWVFGPEFESISFTSNKTLVTVLEDLFGDKVIRDPLRFPRRRPDFVVLPDTTIGVYSSDDFDERHEVMSYRTVMIVELKRGGFTITPDEKTQAQIYARELRKSGKVTRDTKIVAYVLGTNVDEDALEPVTEGATVVRAEPYSVTLRRAHARTFSLAEKIRRAKDDQLLDPDVEEVVSSEETVNV
jgi:hypothetical protein